VPVGWQHDQPWIRILQQASDEHAIANIFYSSSVECTRMASAKQALFTFLTLPRPSSLAAATRQQASTNDQVARAQASRASTTCPGFGCVVAAFTTVAARAK
jgi:hypothetical protein